MTGPFVNRLLAVMAESDECPADLLAEDWVDLAARYEGPPFAAIVDRTGAAVARFIPQRTRSELFELSLQRHLLVMPLATPKTVMASPQLAYRESMARPDQVRGAGIPRDQAGGPENSVGWHNVNADKLSLQLNLSVPEARAALIAPGVAKRLGLGPDELRAVNDQLIYVSTALFGQSGPMSAVPGFGNMGAAAGGFYALTGWPDRLLAGPYLAYTDATSPRLTVAVVVAALDWRRRSGRGLTIDFSQIEGGVHFLSPALLEYEVNGDHTSRIGNADRRFVPHGVYPAGDPTADRWVSLACRSDDDWRAICSWMQRPDLVDLGTDERRSRQQEIDDLLSAWTAGQDPAAWEAAGQARQLAVHQVQNSPECIADPQLAHRAHYVTVDHAVYGHSSAEQFGVRSSRSGRLPPSRAVLGRAQRLRAARGAWLRRRPDHRPDYRRRPRIAPGGVQPWRPPSTTNSWPVQ